MLQKLLLGKKGRRFLWLQSKGAADCVPGLVRGSADVAAAKTNITKREEIVEGQPRRIGEGGLSRFPASSLVQFH